MKKIIFMLMILLNFSSFARVPNVAFFSPVPKGNIYWDEVIQIINKSANNLNINLTIIFPPKSGIFELKNTIENEIIIKKFDYVIITYPGIFGKNILDFLESKKIYSIIISKLSNEEKNLIKNPGEYYKYWIGNVYSDDYEQGYLLAKELLKSYSSTLEKIDMISINGYRGITATNDRENGMLKAIEESKNIVLKQAFYVNDWSIKGSKELTDEAIKRYPNVKIIWTASDNLALGVTDTSYKGIIGSIDGTKPILNLMKNNKISATVVGGQLNSLISLILIKDHSEGINIKKSSIIKSELKIINKKNVKNYEESMESLNGIKHSKFFNKNISDYNFNFF